MNIQNNKNTNLFHIQELNLPSRENGPGNPNPINDTTQIIDKRLMHFLAKDELVTNESILSKSIVNVVKFEKEDVKSISSTQLADKILVYGEYVDTNDIPAQKLLGSAYENRSGDDNYMSQAITWYKKAAENGDAFAQNKLGYFYLEGIGVAKDAHQALTWFEKSANQKYGVSRWVSRSILAIYRKMHWSYRGTDYDITSITSERCRKQYAQDGNALPRRYIDILPELIKPYQWKDYICDLIELGEQYEKGIGFEKSEQNAAKYYMKAAEHGSAEAQIKYARCLQQGIGVLQDKDQALEWYKKAAAQGNMEANIFVLEKDAIDNNDAAAQRELGKLHETGSKINRNITQAFRWYQKAAVNGDAFAQNKLGYFYDVNKIPDLILPSWEKGPGNEHPCKNRIKVIGKRIMHFFAKGELLTNESIRDKFDTVVLNLAKIDGTSSFTKINNINRAFAAFKTIEIPYSHNLGYLNQEFFERLRKTEKQFYDDLNTLGKSYETGDGFEKNEQQAAMYYKTAAEHGIVDAQNNYARCLQHGIGIPQNENQALEWYKLTASYGNLSSNNASVSLDLKKYSAENLWGQPDDHRFYYTPALSLFGFRCKEL